MSAQEKGVGHTPPVERGQCDLDDLLTIDTARDVRTLRGCAHCGGLGHKTQMIEGQPTETPSKPWFHGRCFAEKFGEKELLALGRIQLDHLCMGDIGVRLMRAVIDRVDGVSASRGGK